MTTRSTLGILLAALGGWTGIATMEGCGGNVASSGNASGGSSPVDPCIDGTERCACYRNSTCDAELTCASGLCVRLAAAMGGNTSSTMIASTGGRPTQQSQQSGGVDQTWITGSGSAGAPSPGGLGGASNGGTASSVGGAPVAVTSSPNGGRAGTSGATAAFDVAGTAGMRSFGGGTAAGTTATTGGAGSTLASSGMPATGGVRATGGATNHDFGACDSTTNLIEDALRSATHNWIGGDSALSRDNPCGVQGGIYAASDSGFDDKLGTPDDSLSIPSQGISPCTDGHCCISGRTSLWPLRNGERDYSVSLWGAALGIHLNDPGDSATLRGYAGPAKGFVLELSGQLNGQTLRLVYTQRAVDACGPYRDVTRLGTHELAFMTGVACPTWACTPSCVAPGPAPFELMVQVVGGDVAGDFTVCLDRVTPIL